MWRTVNRVRTSHGGCADRLFKYGGGGTLEYAIAIDRIAFKCPNRFCRKPKIDRFTAFLSTTFVKRLDHLVSNFKKQIHKLFLCNQLQIRTLHKQIYSVDGRSFVRFRLLTWSFFYFYTFLLPLPYSSFDSYHYVPYDCVSRRWYLIVVSNWNTAAPASHHGGARVIVKVQNASTYALTFGRP